MAITMRDVAARAEVSLKTVSRVVNHAPHVRPELVDRVEAAMRDLAWRPNPAAQALRSGQTGIIAIALPSLTRSFVARLAEAVVTEATRRGFQADLDPSPSDNRVRQMLGMVGRSCDAVILVDIPYPGLAIAPGAPVVSIMRSHPGADRVMPDLTLAAQLLAGHLQVLGRRDPLLIGFDRFGADQQLFFEAFSAHGLGDRPPIRAVATRADGQAVAAQIITSTPPDAIVAASDDLALGLLSGLAELGVRVPEDMAVASIDNVEDDMFAYPSLTSIDPSPNEMARVALDVVTDRIAGRDATARTWTVPVTLMRRESTMGIGTS